MPPTLNPAQPPKPLVSHLPLVPYPAWTHHHPPCGPAGSSFPAASCPQSIQLSQSHPHLDPGCPLSSETPKKPFPVVLAHTHWHLSQAQKKQRRLCGFPTHTVPSSQLSGYRASRGSGSSLYVHPPGNTQPPEPSRLVILGGARGVSPLPTHTPSLFSPSTSRLRNPSSTKPRPH